MSEKVTYQELVHSLSGKTGKSARESDRFIHELVQVIEEALVKDGQTHLAGFGKWERRHYDARPGRHPQTGEPIEIPSHERAVFKPYKALRDRVNSDFLHLDPRPVTLRAASRPDPMSNSKPDPVRKDAPSDSDMSRSGGGDSEPLLIVRERPKNAGPPPFFIELDEGETEPEPKDDLIRVRPSPAVDRQGDTEKS